MCLTFVYRKEKTLVGMNFDNDGKDFKISVGDAHDFLVSVCVGNVYFPSFGINRNGIFVNDLMVDSNGAGKYKRQNEKRWVTTSFIKYIMENDVSFEDIKNVLQRIEIVNAPNSSTHNLVVDCYGNICVVEPGRKNIFTGPQDSDWYVMTSFPLSDYDEIVPTHVSGGGADRYLKALSRLAAIRGQMTVEQGFDVLKNVQQDGPTWTTELSLIYDGSKQELFYCSDRNFDAITKCDLYSPDTVFKSH